MEGELEEITSLLEDGSADSLEEEIDDAVEEGREGWETEDSAEEVIKEASEDAEETLPPQERSRGVSINNAKRFCFIVGLFYPMEGHEDISTHHK